MCKTFETGVAAQIASAVMEILSEYMDLDPASPAGVQVSSRFFTEGIEAVSFLQANECPSIPEVPENYSPEYN